MGVGLRHHRSASDVDYRRLFGGAARDSSPLILAKSRRHLVRLGISWVSDVIGAGSHVEVGYERLAELQEEILWLCEAAHLPVIWATQVLEQLAKSGLPSRAEISDAAMGERAECVMVNKGPAQE